VVLYTSLSAALVSTAFVHNDLKVLEELDIKSNFITDYQLQKEFNKRLEYSQNHYAEKLNSAYLFIPQIKKILKENNMPSAFLYLVMAESEFILDASSSKKAKGLWQFMPRTARYFGLETNNYIDERLDIVKSTQAAVTYLKKLHDMFDKWYLAAVAYNCGEVRVIEGLTRAMLDKHCETVGYKVCRKEPEVRYARQVIRDYQSKKAGYRKLNKVYKKIKSLGYSLDIDEILLEQTIVDRQYIPTESRRYIRKIVSLAMMNNSDFLLKDQNFHLVNRGLTDPIAAVDVPGGVRIKDLSQLIGLDDEKLRELNLHVKKGIIPFDKESYQVYIPYSKLSRYNANKQSLKKASPMSLYVVKSGDSLYKISKQYDLSVSELKKYNDLQSNLLRIGQEIIIPLDPNYEEPVSNYVIRIGDTLSKIASTHNISLEKLMKDNDLKTSMIKVGDTLVIKK
jgi:membrane-bound lytic murein transglycosylase D